MAMLALFTFYKSQLKVWQKVLAVLFAPIMIAICIIGVIVLCIDHIVKHGFHNILPRRKGKQGWRMRFNSNSVKNSPDYVK